MPAAVPHQEPSTAMGVVCLCTASIVSDAPRQESGGGVGARWAAAFTLAAPGWELRRVRWGPMVQGRHAWGHLLAAYCDTLRSSACRLLRDSSRSAGVQGRCDEKRSGASRLAPSERQTDTLLLPAAGSNSSVRAELITEVLESLTPALGPSAREACSVGGCHCLRQTPLLPGRQASERRRPGMPRLPGARG